MRRSAARSTLRSVIWTIRVLSKARRWALHRASEGDYQAKKWLKVGGNMCRMRTSAAATATRMKDRIPRRPISSHSRRRCPDLPGIHPRRFGPHHGGRQRSSDVRLRRQGQCGPDPSAAARRQRTADQLAQQEESRGRLFGQRLRGHLALQGAEADGNGSTNIDETRTTYLNNQYYGQFAEAGGTIRSTTPATSPTTFSRF